MYKMYNKLVRKNAYISYYFFLRKETIIYFILHVYLLTQNILCLLHIHIYAK